MEMFIVRLVEKVHQWQDDTRFCFTRDVYELCFAELLKVLPLPHSDHVKVQTISDYRQTNYRRCRLSADRLLLLISRPLKKFEKMAEYRSVPATLKMKIADTCVAPRWYMP